MNFIRISHSHVAFAAVGTVCMFKRYRRYISGLPSGMMSNLVLLILIVVTER
ncbi:hypothetical protein ETAE_1471 [Edwardsiella piscicida]|uniref:Uncharacterized protein n=1 Tax=Edwardsiella piscicida TaxID=1263550 RepID=A0AAU8PGW3_EDWPI|nr:hypothetical protein ETAE_1471 [Edwardsiella tarda EIB202]